MIQKIINRYKRARTNTRLSQNYDSQYAFIGMGQHSLNNLYPVLDYLHIPLKYICVTSENKVKLINRKFRWTKGTISVDEILKDNSIKGVFVSVSPSAHFEIAKKVLNSGKSLFIEKPPCKTLDELIELIDMQHKHGSPIVVVGMQKRYSPVIGILYKRLKKEKIVSYNLRYLAGAYPEGVALTDLYIHPLDIVTYLFGGAKLIACERISSDSLMLILKHGEVTGMLELSTEYSWKNAQETLSVCTQAGVYKIDNMEELTFMPRQGKICGIPLEKVFNRANTVEYLYSRNNFSPILVNNQVYTQGFYTEIQSFVNSVEGVDSKNNSGLDSLIETYRLIDIIRNRIM